MNESPLKPVDEENEVRHPPQEKLDALYWAMVDDGILAMPEDKELLASIGK